MSTAYPFFLSQSSGMTKCLRKVPLLHLMSCIRFCETKQRSSLICLMSLSLFLRSRCLKLRISLRQLVSNFPPTSSRLMACLTGCPSKKGVMQVALYELSTTRAYLSEMAQDVLRRSALQSERAWSQRRADEGRTKRPSQRKYSRQISIWRSMTLRGWQGRVGRVIEKSSQQNPVVFLGISNLAISSSSMVTQASKRTVTPLTLFFSQMSLVSSRMPSREGPNILLPVVRSMAMKLSQTKVGRGLLALPNRMEQLPPSITIRLLLSSRQAIIIYIYHHRNPQGANCLSKHTKYNKIQYLYHHNQPNQTSQIQQQSNLWQSFLIYISKYLGSIIALYVLIGKKSLIIQKKSLLIINIIMEQPESSKTIAVIIAEIKSTSRELYPLTKNYPMALLSIGPKKLIVYQLEALLTVPHLQKIVIVGSEEQPQLQQFVETQFLSFHRSFPHKIQFHVTKDIANTTFALKEVVAAEKQIYRNYIVMHADTLSAVPLKDMLLFHQQHRSEATLIAKPKRELGEQEKKLPEGELETEIDNVLIGQNGQCLFLDMMEELENEGVKIDPSIFKQVRKGSFRRIVDSRTYIFGPRIIRILLNLNHEEVYEVKPYLVQLLVKHQTNSRLLSLADSTEGPAAPLRIFIHLSDQNAYIRKIASKKIYQAMNFDSIIRGPKQKEVLLPTAYSDPLDQRKEFKGNANVIESATIAGNSRLRRSCIGANCKIGKNVEIINSILLDNVEVKDNCKIAESVLGSGCSIGEGVSIKSTYAEGGCRVADGASIESEVLIRSE